MADENKPQQIRLVQSLEGDDVFGPVESVTGDDGTGSGTRPDTIDFMLGTTPPGSPGASDTAARMQNITPGASQPRQQQQPAAQPAQATEPAPAPEPFKLFGMDVLTIAKIALGGALIYLALAPEKKSKLGSLAGNIHRVDIEGEGEDEWEDEEDEAPEVAATPLAGDKPKPKKKRKPRKPKLKMAPPSAPLGDAPVVEPEVVKSVPAEAKVVA